MIGCWLLVVAATLQAQERFEVGRRAPRLTIERLDGGTFRTGGKGGVVLLSFWATWCGPCMKELAEVPEQILRRFEGEDFRFLAVAVNEPRVTVAKKAAQLAARGLRFPIGLDPYGRIGERTGDSRLPQLVLIDRRGIVRLHEIGYTPERIAEVADRIGALLAE